MCFMTLYGSSYDNVLIICGRWRDGRQPGGGGGIAAGAAMAARALPTRAVCPCLRFGRDLVQCVLNTWAVDSLFHARFIIPIPWSIFDSKG